MAEKTDGLINEFHGQIFDLKIYDTLLSDSQIYSLANQQGLTLGFGETAVGEIWRACVTANDGLNDSDTICSENITIQSEYYPPSMFSSNSEAEGNISSYSVISPIDQNVTLSDGSGKRMTFTGLFGSSIVDLTGIVINTTATITVVNASAVSGISPSFSLYVPNTGIGVTVCPNASTVSEVSALCANKVTFSNSEVLSGTTKQGYTVSLDGDDIRVQNITGTGIISGTDSNLQIFDSADPEGEAK